MDYYSLLGISNTATKDEIKKAYRKLANAYHPDKPSGDEEKFKQIQEAYDTLSDDAKRQEYDSPFSHRDYFSDFSRQRKEDLFRNIFRQQAQRRQQSIRKNKDIKITMRLSLEEAFLGKLVKARYSMPSGKKEEASINIPAGIASGDTIRYNGMGDDSIVGMPRGDLLLSIVVEPHRVFQRNQKNLSITKKINVLDLLTGTSLEIKMLDDNIINVDIPKGTHAGTTLLVRGQGMPDPKTNTRGDLCVTLKAITPRLNEDQIKKIQEVKNANN